MFLFTFTMTINYIALFIAWWFGLYVVTRNPRGLISWLTGLTFWTMAGLFLNFLLALAPPPPPHNFPNWLQYFLLIWPMGTLEGSSGSWLQGWSITLSIMVWHHVTVLLRPGDFSKWRGVRVGFGYLIALFVIIIQSLNTHLLYTSTSGDPLYLSSLKPGPLYPLIAIGMLLYTGMSIYNLLRSVRVASNTIHREQYRTLGIATLIAGTTVPISILGSTTSIPIPMVVLSILYIITIAMMGYSVARYSALSKGRTIRRDLIYNAVAMATIILLYVLITWGSVSFYNAPVAAFIPMILLAITTHMLIDMSRLTLDSFFHHRGNRELRARFRQLAGAIGEEEPTKIISLVLDSMSSTVHATYCLVLLFNGQRVNKLAAHNWTQKLPPLTPAELSADDVLSLEPEHFNDPLHDITLLIPLYADAEQIGVILLGRPVNGLAYSQTDIELLLYPSDKLAEVIRDAQQQERYLDQLTQATVKQRTSFEADPEQISVKDVENALRNLTNYAYLGDTKLAKLSLVQLRLSAKETTHLDKGKAVYSIISKTIEKLRPDATDIPSYPIPREWHAYLILHDAYIADKSNREIMAQLYISEGTFNRTRRAAVRSIARALEEMEISIV
ncbi:MAG: hypothetical protein HN916_16925 [Anaerolineae bacterium]|nr:hypothetical protein [Anaerolineae bacterium]